MHSSRLSRFYAFYKYVCKVDSSCRTFLRRIYSNTCMFRGSERFQYGLEYCTSCSHFDRR